MKITIHVDNLQTDAEFVVLWTEGGIKLTTEKVVLFSFPWLFTDFGNGGEIVHKWEILNDDSPPNHLVIEYKGMCR